MTSLTSDRTDELRLRTIKRCINLLAWVYTTDPEEIDVPDEYHVPRGERRLPMTRAEQMRYIGYQLKNRGRRNPVALLSTNLIQHLDESKHHAVFLLIELSEMDLLLDQDHILPTLIRTCSALQPLLNERIAEGDTDKDLSPVIREARKEHVLTFEEIKLAQFIRHCRNDASHNLFYNTEMGFVVHHHAAVCVVTLLNSLLESWYGVEWNVENRISAELGIRLIEQEFGFEWIPERLTYDDSLLDER
jgi:hypothetical protein